MLPGHLQIACVIENLSDGGALLWFTEGAAPTQSFRLAIEGTEFNLVCELRHRAGRKLGVRFVRPAEGIALNRHFQKTSVEPTGAEVHLPIAKPLRAVASRSVRELRRTVLGIGATAPQIEGTAASVAVILTLAADQIAPQTATEVEAAQPAEMPPSYLPALVPATMLASAISTEIAAAV